MSFKMMMLVIVLSLSIQADEKGWLWYAGVPAPETQVTDKRNEDVPVRENPVSPQKKKETTWERSKRENEALKQSFVKATDIFMADPTLENALEAQRLQRVIMNRATVASKAWGIAALMDPALIPQSENPNNLHRKMWKEKEEADTLALLKEASKNWGILFETREVCPFCTRFAPIVHEFSTLTGFQVLAVSESGKDYGPFKGVKGVELLKDLNPENLVPTVYLVNSAGTKIIPVARGMVSPEDLIRGVKDGIQWKDEGES